MTILDQFELDFKSVDEVTPSLKELVGELSNFPNLSPSDELIVRLNKWLDKMKNM